jgi:DNA-binding NarL/FixJ family response regulator
VVPRDAAPATARAAFEAAVNGNSLLPIEVLQALASAPGDATIATTGDTPTAREIEWLRELAHGVSVAQLADRAGYSERMMFRLLVSLVRDPLLVRRCLMRSRHVCAGSVQT